MSPISGEDEASVDFRFVRQSFTRRPPRLPSGEDDARAALVRRFRRTRAHAFRARVDLCRLGLGLGLCLGLGRALTPFVSMTSSGSGKVVCVTGASGFIASWIVKLLLQRGYTVRAFVRDLADPNKTQHLRALEGATERLHLFKANLLEEGSFDAGIEDSDGVFHTASPYYHGVIDAQAEFIDPALNGTLNVLASCKKFSTKRVIVTSSIAAVAFNDKPRSPDVVVDETWFSCPEFCEREKLWYILSKTLAEAAAWKFANENAMDIVTINPALVIGPLLQPTLNTSCSAILNLINGSSTFPNASVGWVNVKDVAIAHILAFELPSASGRYCLVERVSHFSELVRIVRDLCPALQVPEKCADDKPFEPIYQVSKEKFESLGLDYIPLETSIKETIESLKEKKFVVSNI